MSESGANDDVKTRARNRQSRRARDGGLNKVVNF